MLKVVLMHLVALQAFGRCVFYANCSGTEEDFGAFVFCSSECSKEVLRMLDWRRLHIWHVFLVAEEVAFGAYVS